MKAWRDFDIDIYKLSNQKHYYNFDLEDVFFSNFPDSLLTKGKLKVDLIIEKSETFIISIFDIKGMVELTCDRSLELFDFEIITKNKLIFKFGEDLVEITDEIVTIPRDAQKINVAQYIYEFIGLAIPMKKLHPKFEKEYLEDRDDQETILIYSTEKDKSEEKAPEDQVDPRWKVLNGLKHNNN
jgi:uncharacterized protein